MEKIIIYLRSLPFQKRIKYPSLGSILSPMKAMPTRLVIYAKDVMNITGRRERCAYKLMAQIRKRYSKGKGSFVSIDEFCEFTGLREERVLNFLK